MLTHRQHWPSNTYQPFDWRLATLLRMKPDANATYMSKTVKIATVVATYWVVSISLVFLNKYLLSSQELKLDAPYFVTWFQCLVSLMLCFALSAVASAVPWLLKFPSARIDPKVCRDVAPLSLVFVAMITFNNLCLKNVGVSFYYAGRSFTTVFNALLSYAILGQSTSHRAIGCCAFIVVGFLLGVNQENESGSLSVSGIIYGLLASLFVALNAIYTKKVLPSVDNNVWKLTLYNNFNAIFIFIPCLLVSGDIGSVIGFHSVTDGNFWLIMSISGLLGFGIGYVTGLQIQYTSPLTHNVSGTAKACAQTVMGYFIYAEVKTALWWCSNFIVLAASFAYTVVKRQEMKQQLHTEMAKMATQLEEGDRSDNREIKN